MKFAHLEFNVDGRNKKFLVARPETDDEERDVGHLRFRSRGRIATTQVARVVVQTLFHIPHAYEFDGRRSVDVGSRDVMRDWGRVATRSMGRWRRRNDSLSAWPCDEFGVKADIVLGTKNTSLVSKPRL